MIAGQLMPALARRIENALQQRGHHSPGDDAESFALVLEDLTAMAKPVEDDRGQDDEDGTPPPKTESGTLPEVMNPGSVPLAPTREGKAQSEFLETVSVSLSLTSVMALSEWKSGPSEEAEPSDYPELRPGPFQKSDDGERLSVPFSGETRRALIEIMEDKDGHQAGKAAVPALLYQDDSAAAPEAALVAAGLEEVKVTPYASPALQILAAIRAEAPQTGNQSAMPAASHAAQVSSPVLPPPSDVKAFRLKLQPEELGEVEVTIRRVGLQTKVTITVTGKASADAVSKDKGILEERLSGLFTPGHGAAVSFNIEIRDVSAGQEQSPMASGGQGFPGAALPDGRSPRREERSDSEHQPRMRARHEREVETSDASPVPDGDRIV